MFKDTGELNVNRDVAVDVIMYVTRKEDAPVRLVTGQDKDEQKQNGQERNVIDVNQDTGDVNVNRDVVIHVVFMEKVEPHAIKIKDTMITVYQDTGGVNVNRDVAMDVIIMNVRRKMEVVHVNLAGEERDVKTVCKYMYTFKNTFLIKSYYKITFLE